ncbi:D-alanine-D-alanine ligase [Saccharopolyspora antimicrobica]|uniref:D-alanine--D-alanine ligase n=1 Tax=Saccharopolyspora antimicrobica TaxID=455193 RepID=A0A1I5IQW2_9PSEU|nr:D-alanine--D-alanine ligase family protein [Saccharopolyspora antimicrobica]RKT84112.1 D-alanine-D-alanine ligase [Saccharopolyspora antimicrobica]SFO62720.1 D-alanine-D-alanine ligase [Saccharopolyspora antimicrobica]
MSHEGNLRVAVVFGGRSDEHDVSCGSAASVLAHLDRRRYDVVPVKIEPDGTWIVGKDDPDLFTAADQRARPFLTDDFARVHGSEEQALSGIPRALEQIQDADVLFPALHGPYGEDGTLQAMLDMCGIPFVGNGVLASAVGMDKEYAKKLLAAAGLAVADGVVLRDDRDALSTAEKERLGLPVYVKPARSGSSVGVSRVDAWEALPTAIAAAKRSDRKVLVEAALTGREIDVGVLERPDGSVEVSPPLEIRLAPHQRLFDHEAKYTDSGTTFEVPARLDPQTTEHLRVLSLRAFAALECSGLLRVDFFVDDDGTATVNEVNTFPGFTSSSQYPRMWQAVGLEYAELLDTLIETALQPGLPSPLSARSTA